MLCTSSSSAVPNQVRDTFSLTGAEIINVEDESLRAVSNTEPVQPAISSRWNVRLAVWVMFVFVSLITVVGFNLVQEAAPIPAATWAIESPGVLEVSGKPSISVSQGVDGELVVSIDTVAGRQVHRTNLFTGENNSVHTFWRGDQVIVDAGGRVVSINPENAVMRDVPASFGWGSAA
jgi:hypothetical protein